MDVCRIKEDVVMIHQLVQIRSATSVGATGDTEHVKSTEFLREIGAMTLLDVTGVLKLDKR